MLHAIQVHTSKTVQPYFELCSRQTHSILSILSPYVFAFESTLIFDKKNMKRKGLRGQGE
jgi:hypothetical protein